MPDSMISEKPMMALSGVRSSWLILARNFDLAWLASSARVFSAAYFSASSRQPLLRGAQVGDRRHQPLLAVDQLFLVRLERGDVGADRDIAAVLGAPLADVQPAAVLELRLEGARARNARAAGDDLVAHHRLAAGGDHRLVGGADHDRLVGQVVQLLEIRIAQHQAIVGVPQHEGFRDGLDGVAQAHVGGDRLLDQVLLLGDVDRDADQMQARLARLAHQLAARAQPHPVAVGVAHAEGVIDGGRLGIGEFGRELVEPQVVRMDQRADVAERQQVVLGLQARECRTSTATRRCGRARRSQSHKPQRPRLSAVSMRLRTVS